MRFVPELFRELQGIALPRITAGRHGAGAQKYNERWARRKSIAQKSSISLAQSFAKAAENAVAEAAKTVRGLKWARVAGLQMELEGPKIMQYRATTKIYFAVEQQS